MKRRALVFFLLVGGLAVVGVAAVALRYTVFFEAQPTWYRLLEGGPPPGERRAMLAARHHRASTACLRYPAKVPEPDEEKALAAKLVAAGLVEPIGQAVLLTLVWQAQEESRAHAKGSADEVLELVAERAGPFDRMIIALHEDELIGVADLDVPSARLEAMRRDAEAALTSDQIAKLRAIWEENKVTLAATRGLPARVRRRATEERLDALEAALQSWQQREGAPAARLEDLGLPSEPGHRPLVDGWGKPFSYGATPEGARVTSLGANMRPEGGDDITREIVAPRDAAERPLAPAEPAPIPRAHPIGLQRSAIGDHRSAARPPVICRWVIRGTPLAPHGPAARSSGLGRSVLGHPATGPR